jgi:hypothetical protein
MATPAQAKLMILSGKLSNLNKLTKKELIALVKSVRPDIDEGLSDNGPMWGDQNGVVTGYMDKVDWDYEIGGAAGGNKVFPSIDDLEYCKPCVQSCGIVEVQVKLKRIIKESDFSERIARGKKLSEEERFEKAKKRRDLHLTALQLAKLPLEEIQEIIHRASEENEKNAKRKQRMGGKTKVERKKGRLKSK